MQRRMSAILDTKANREATRPLVDLGYSRVVVVAPEHLDEVVPGCVPPTLSFLIYLLATPSNNSPGATRP